MDELCIKNELIRLIREDDAGSVDAFICSHQVDPDEILLDYHNCGFEERLLTWAIRDGGYDLLVVLVRNHNADVNYVIREHFGNTPLMISVGQGVQYVETLVEEGEAKLDLRNDAGFTALLRACHWNCFGAAIFLIEKGANVNAASNDGKTGLHMAACHGNLGVVKHLVRYGARLDATDANGSTPLHVAVTYAHHSVVEFLLEANADWTTKDHKGYMPVDYVVTVCNSDVEVFVKVLDRWIAKRSAVLRGYNQEASLLFKISDPGLRELIASFAGSSLMKNTILEKARQELDRLRPYLGRKTTERYSNKRAKTSH